MDAQHGDPAGAPDEGPAAGPHPPPSEPPPTPFERRAAVPAPPAPPRRRRGAVLAAAAAVLLIAGGAALLTAREDAAPPADDAAPATDAGVDAALLALLSDVDAGELAMLGFDEAAGEAFAAAGSEEEALRGVGAAAAAAVADLEDVRARIDAPRSVAPAETVRAAYLPHLDAWIAYLAAVAADPTVLAGEDAEPLILRINATAGVFAAALEEVVAAGVGPDVAGAAAEILERGFPAEEDAQL